MKKQVALIILDGWGNREEKEHNAIATAHTPFFDYLWQNYPHSLLKAGEEAVGLPVGQVGNSEIGHMTIGAGKTIDTDLVRIEKAIKSDEFDSNFAFQKLFKHVIQNNSTLHVLGMIGRGGVHSHEDHLFAFLKSANKAGIKKISLHIFTDGRDQNITDSILAFKKLEEVLRNIKAGKISTISGRYYAMDRDNNWDRLAEFTKYFFDDEGKNKDQICTLSPVDELQRQHKLGISDEHIEPVQFDFSPLNQDDGVFFINFRADRARMLSSEILKKEKEKNICFVTMTEYGADFKTEVAFPAIKIETTLAKEISQSGLSQAHIAETEKFPHATYFLNGGVEKPYPKEEHVLLESRKDVKTHDEAPEMRAESIAEEAIKRIEKGVDFIFINFANPDMVGHTANVPAIVKAIEWTDLQLKRIVVALEKRDGVAFITADHGNAEINFDTQKSEKHTAHTLSLVPAIITDKKLKIKDGSLKDIAPTILTLLDLSRPKSMTGESLIS